MKVPQKKACGTFCGTFWGGTAALNRLLNPRTKLGNGGRLSSEST
jgi:hypothetical protein